MTRIQTKLDAIIYNLNRLPECEHVRFVREYPNIDCETPVTGYLAGVGIKSTELKDSYLGRMATPSVRGGVYCAEAEIRLYAPKSQNGSGLSELVFKLQRALDLADEDNIISDIRAGSIEFDTNVSAVFRRISFKMEICLGGEEEDE